MLTSGVVGCGKSSQEYQLPVIEALDEFDLQWVCDLDADRATTVGREYGVTAHTDTDRALAETPDVVHVNTPPFTHRDVAVDALRAGAHVLVEKPMAMSVEECREMAAVAEEEDRKLCVVHNNLFFEPMRRVMDRVERGDYGELVSVSSFLGGQPNPGEKRDWTAQAHGGRVGDRLPHPLYLVTHFLPDAEISAVRTVEKSEGVLDGVNLQLDAPDRFGNVQVSERAKPSKFVKVVGSERMALVDLFNYVGVEYDTADRSPVAIVTDNLGAAGQLISGTAENVLDYARQSRRPGNKFAGPGHYNLMREFAESIRRDTEVPIPAEEGERVVRLLSAIEADVKGTEESDESDDATESARDASGTAESAPR